jgi:uncharacterized membrane protein
METVAPTEKTLRESTAKSWLAVLALGLAIFGLLYGAAALFAAHMWRWFYRWVDWNGTSLVFIGALILTLIILLAAVLAHGFERGHQRAERRALILGSWVLYLPAFAGGLFAAGGLSYLMYFAFVGGGLMSAVAWLLIKSSTMPPDWGLWIALGVVGHGTVDRPEDGAWHVVALLVVAIGLAITILGFVQVFRAHREKRLQTDGLYAAVRHPQHLGIALWTFGLAFAASTTAAYMTWFTVLYFYMLLALWEESRLRQQFGSAYDSYRTATPFVTPFVNVALPLPKSRGRRAACLAGYYIAGMAVLCLTMQAIGVEIAWYI